MDADEQRRLAALEQRVQDIDNQVSRLLPLAETMAGFGVKLDHIESGMTKLGADIHGIESMLDDRDKAVSAERKATRTALYSLVGVLAAALISGLASILVAVLS